MVVAQEHHHRLVEDDVRSAHQTAEDAKPHIVNGGCLVSRIPNHREKDELLRFEAVLRKMRLVESDQRH